MQAPPAPGPGARERAGVGLPLLSGLFLALSHPPSSLPLLSFVALAPLALAVERAPPGPPGRAVTLQAGLVVGAVSWGLLLHWIPAALLPVAPLLAIPAWLATVGLLAALTAVVARGAHALRLRGVPVALALPLAWTAGEWARGQAGILAIPWLPLGGALAPLPAWAAPAELVGVHGLSFWTACVGCGTAGLAAAPRSDGPGDGRRRPSGALALGAVLLLPPLWGAIRNAGLELRSVGEVAAVQLRLHLPPGVPADPAVVTSALAPLLDAVAPGALDLLVLPEAVVDAVVGAGTEPADPLPLLRATAARTGAHLLAGGYAPPPGAPARSGAVLNAALLLRPDGSLEVVHGKRHLVPGIERGLPPPFHRLPGGRHLAEGGMVAGRDPGRIQLPGGDAGILICYEAAFPRAARVPRREGAVVLLAMTHEGWFGPERSTIARAQHIAHLQMRSVETRAGSLRAALDGEALLLDPRGRVVARGGAAPSTLVRGSLYTVDGVPLHVRTGDLAGAGSLLATLLLVVAGGRRPSPGLRQLPSRGRG